MKVGIIGSGVVGQTLAAGFLKHGHQVEIGTRDPAKLKDWSAKTPGAAVKSFAEAAAFGDVVVLAVGGEVAQQALTLIGSSALQGKTVIDACNPIGGGPPVNGVLSFFTPQNQSLMEQLQGAIRPLVSSKRSILSAVARWSIPSSPVEGRPCSSAAMTRTPRRRLSVFSSSSVGILRIWARSSRRGRSRRFACCGASPALERTIGRRTLSSSCGDPLSPCRVPNRWFVPYM